MAYFRCGQGGGSSLTIQISTTSESLYGQTITISKNGSTVGTTTFDNQGEAEYTVDEAGTYTVSATVSGTTYSDTVEVTDTFEASIEAGFNYHTWLVDGDVSDTYSSLNEVLADEEAVRKLMTIHDAVDYLASFTSDDASVVTILNNDLAAKWISLTDYAMDVLEAAYSTLMGTIGKYGYGEWELQAKVPTMTSNTTPYGEASASTEYDSNSKAWKAFDGNDSTYWASNTIGTNQYIAYEFTTPVLVRRVVFRAWYSGGFIRVKDYEIQVYDGSDWVKLAEGTYANNEHNEVVELDGSTAYSKIRLYVKNTYSSDTSNAIGVTSLQFYAYSAKGAVPVMTSDTAPYGTVIYSTQYGSPYLGVNAFDGTVPSSSTVSATDYQHSWIPNNGATNNSLGYKFTTPTCIKRVKFNIIGWAGSTTYSNNDDIKVQGSNDGTTWETIKTYGSPITFANNSFNYLTIDMADNDEYYLQYRLFIAPVMTVNGSASTAVRTLQFYGRELKVSVPTMTSSAAPYGTASGIAYGQNADSTAWKAFDGNDGTETSTIYVSTNSSGGGHVAYEFVSPVIVKRVYFVSTYYTGQSPSYGVKDVSLYGSDDGLTWTLLASATRTDNSVRAFSFDVNNNTAYTHYKLAPDSNHGGNDMYVEFSTIQFYGVDYSEREWDTEHPRHYIYDHGVELETLTADGYTGSSYTITMPTKEPSQLYFPAVGSSQMKLAGIDAAIDMTPYTLERICVGDKMTADSSNSGSIMVATTKYNSLSTAYCLTYLNLVPSLSYPNQIGVDVSSVNQSVFTNIMSGYSTRSLSITEWWLE